jgi:two-component system chemotaxis response regulator CheB
VTENRSPAADERALKGAIDAVVIGTSAGGIEALGILLPSLVAGYRLPVIIAIHLSADRPSLLAEIFAPRCRVRVKEAEDKETLEPGVVYFAPPGYHLLIERGKYFGLSVEEPVHYSRPSIDVLFDSALDVYGNRLLGILLTGANEDGAEGLCAIHAAGGAAVVQDPTTASSREMPAAALRDCPSARVLTLQEMVPLLHAIGAPRESGQ